MDYEGHGYIYFDEHKVDLMPSALIAWMEMQGWLDVRRIEEDMGKE